MSFSAPTAYGIKRMSARIVSHGAVGGVLSWLEIRFVDKYADSEDIMHVHFAKESADQFNMLAEAIMHIFGENPPKEKISEV